MLTAIAKPFGLLMLWLYNITGNYGLAITLFALIVNMILLPFMWKSKKSMMRTTRLQPKIAELQKKHEGNQHKLNEEMQRLYREEKAHPMSGCLWSLIPFPILIALYQAIRFPITIMMGVPADLLEEGGSIYQKLQELGYNIANYTTGTRAGFEQIYESKFITEHFAEFAPLSDKLQPMQYHFLGLDISTTPNFRIWEFDYSSSSVWLPALGLFLIPLLAAFMSWLAMKVSTKTNPQAAGATPQQQSANKGMALMMPAMSIWFCFIMPAALGIYWIINSVIGIIRDVFLTRIFKKQLDIEDAERIKVRNAKEEELERKRQETERLRAENATVQNRNTSKKKMQASQRQKDDERRAAAEKAERAERRARLGIEEPELPPSQSGNRRFARGRAYVEERYYSPETAEEEADAAAAESEIDESIDSSVEETAVTMPAVDTAGAEAEEEVFYELPEEDLEFEAETDADFDDEDIDEQV